MRDRFRAGSDCDDGSKKNNMFEIILVISDQCHRVTMAELAACLLHVQFRAEAWV